MSATYQGRSTPDGTTSTQRKLSTLFLPEAGSRCGEDDAIQSNIGDRLPALERRDVTRASIGKGIRGKPGSLSKEGCLHTGTREKEVQATAYDPRKPLAAIFSSWYVS